jgi:hypothetical protein
MVPGISHQYSVAATFESPKAWRNRPGVRIFGSSKFFWPASRTSTVTEGISESRAARVNPAVS